MLFGSGTDEVPLPCLCVYVFLYLCMFNCDVKRFIFHLSLDLQRLQDTHTHVHIGTQHEVFCLSSPWSGSEETPFRSIPSPKNPLLLLCSIPIQQPLTSLCQGLFPKIRLNMNIHTQNGTPRLWKLSKTYLHLILKELPTPTLPPFTESSLPPFDPLKKSC